MAHGHLRHAPIGTYFLDRRSLYSAGVHRDIRRGICGSAVPGRGAESIVLSGGYEDDVDLGSLIYCTGQGGRDRSGKQVEHQVMEGLNASLARNIDTSDPIRVVRLTDGGLRYDGLYEVEDAWIAPGLSGYRVCRYRLSQLPTVLDRESGIRQPAALDRGSRGAAQRAASTHYRLKRDGVVPRQVKELYGYACQICGVRICTVAGLYAEGAHLVALGWGGDDHTSNVLCLCPNHHVMLDHGAIALTETLQVVNRVGDVLGSLTVLPEHGLNPEYVRLHRQRMGFD